MKVKKVAEVAMSAFVWVVAGLTASVLILLLLAVVPEYVSDHAKRQCSELGGEPASHTMTEIYTACEFGPDMVVYKGISNIQELCEDVLNGRLTEPNEDRSILCE